MIKRVVRVVACPTLFFADLVFYDSSHCSMPLFLHSEWDVPETDVRGQVDGDPGSD
jgi:hypothetical protein